MMMRYWDLSCFVAIAAVSLAPDWAFSQTPSPSSLQLETKIPLGDVKGRIDHMAIDLPRQVCRHGGRNREPWTCWN
jgi:hypothetical protein